MVEVLRVRACDVLWDGRESVESYTQQYEFYNDTVVKSRRRLTVIEYKEVCRLQVCLALMRIEHDLGYFDIYFDADTRVSYLHILLPVEAALGIGVKEVDIALTRLVVNIDERDPFVHYDAKRNLISLPYLSIVTNEVFMDTYGLRKPSKECFEKLFEASVVKNLVHKEDGKVVYANLTCIDLTDYAAVSKNWNYVAQQDCEDNSQCVNIQDTEGNFAGRAFEICMLTTDDVLMADVDLVKNSYNLYKQEDGLSRCFNTQFYKDFHIIYITAPSDMFAFYWLSDEGEECFIPILLRQKSFENRKDIKNLVVATINKSVYLPITSVGTKCVSLLSKFGKNWTEEDLADVGVSPLLDWSEDTKKRAVSRILAQYQAHVDNGTEGDTSYSELAANYLEEYLRGLNIKHFPVNIEELLKELELRCLEQAKDIYLDSLCVGYVGNTSHLLDEDDDDTIIQF